MSYADTGIHLQQFAPSSRLITEVLAMDLLFSTVVWVSERAAVSADLWKRAEKRGTVKKRLFHPHRKYLRANAMQLSQVFSSKL